MQRIFAPMLGMLGVILVAGLVSEPQQVNAVTPENFVVRTTADYLAVCGTPESDPMYEAAMAFCQGYGVGAYHYYQAVDEAAGKKLVCFPNNPNPTRYEIQQGFVAWAEKHTEYATELPVETLFRYLIQKYPCPK